MYSTVNSSVKNHSAVAKLALCRACQACTLSAMTMATLMRIAATMI